MPPIALHATFGWIWIDVRSLPWLQGEGVQQLREALKILAERVLILEHMIGIHGNGDVLLIQAPAAIYQVSISLVS